MNVHSLVIHFKILQESFYKKINFTKIAWKSCSSFSSIKKDLPLNNQEEESSSLIKLTDNQCNRSNFSFYSVNSTCSSPISNYSSSSSVFGNFKRQFFLRRARVSSESPNLSKIPSPKQRYHSSGSLLISFARNNWNKLTR